MNNRALQLHQQRLLLRSSALRLDLAAQAQIFKRPLALADRMSETVQWLYRNPQWPLGLVLILLVVRPGRTLVWAGRVWWLWKTLRFQA